MPSTTLQLSGLNAITPVRALHRAFSIMGRILLVQLNHSEDGVLTGTATIVFECEKSAQRAFREFDQKIFDGRVIHVLQMSTPVTLLAGREYDAWLSRRSPSQF